MQPGNMVIIAARPGVGKSTFAMDIARHAALHNRVPTLFVSLEMSQRELMLRLLAAESSVPLQALKDRKLDPRQWDTISKRSAAIQDAPLWLEDQPGVTPLELRSKARQLKRQGLGLIVLDYLQLLTSGRRVESRQVEVSEFSRQIKLLAKELALPVVALSQLNRQAEARADRKPALSDLRESGSLEQDADIVMLLHRDDMTDAQSRRLGEADVVIPKNRNGQTGTAALAFQGQYSRFASLARP
nr:DnaB-like helicase C-terminal domain-containing protein [Tessaracoccus coleopterorum]